MYLHYEKVVSIHYTTDTSWTTAILENHGPISTTSSISGTTPFFPIAITPLEQN